MSPELEEITKILRGPPHQRLEGLRKSKAKALENLEKIDKILQDTLSCREIYELRIHKAKENLSFLKTSDCPVLLVEYKSIKQELFEAQPLFEQFNKLVVDAQKTFDNWTKVLSTVEKHLMEAEPPKPEGRLLSFKRKKKNV